MITLHSNCIYHIITAFLHSNLIYIYFPLDYKMMDENFSTQSNLKRIQNIMNTQDIGITMIKEKVNAWYPFTPPNSDKPFELGMTLYFFKKFKTFYLSIIPY